MFRTPRRLLCSDGRLTLDDLHERILERLDEGEQGEYIMKMADFFASIDSSDTSVRGSTLQQFACLAHDYLTPDERAAVGAGTGSASDEPGTSVPNPNLTCAQCGSVQYTLSLGYRSCMQCGLCVPHQNQGRSSLTFNDTRDEVHVYPYRWVALASSGPFPPLPCLRSLTPLPSPSRSRAHRRANHFAEWLTQCQAKQSTVIADEVYDAIYAEMRKRRLTKDDLTPSILKSILKALRLNKYYEHNAYLLLRIKGETPLRMSTEVEERMKLLFDQIQKPWEKVIPIVAPKRRNFLSYAYTLRKMAELMELDELAETFPLLKSREKLAQCDRIWRAICAELGWRFIPSL